MAKCVCTHCSCSAPRKVKGHMVRRTRRKVRRKVHRRVSHGKRGYKKCIINTLRRTKFSTPKMARKAFTRAAKKCRAKVMGTTVRRKSTRRKRRKTARSRRR